MSANESGFSRDSLGAQVALDLTDNNHGTSVFVVEKFDADQAAWMRRYSPYKYPESKHFAEYGIKPYEIGTHEGNLITNAGWTRLMNLLTNQGATQALTNLAVRIGTGNSVTTPANYTDTDLFAAAGSTNRWFQVVTGAGTLGTRTLAFSSAFASADGNYAWNEFGMDVGTPTVTSGNTVAALFFNHAVTIAQGTKVAGQVWTATATITFT